MWLQCKIWINNNTIVTFPTSSLLLLSEIPVIPKHSTLHELLALQPSVESRKMWIVQQQLPLLVA